MIREKPIAGWGPSATEVLADRMFYYGGMERSTHNSVLAILTFAGLLGAIPYVWMQLTLLRNTWRARRGVENILPLAIFVALFVAEMSSGGFPEKLHWTFMSYQLAAGHLVRLATRPGAVARRIPSPAPLEHVRRPSRAFWRGSTACALNTSPPRPDQRCPL